MRRAVRVYAAVGVGLVAALGAAAEARAESSAVVTGSFSDACRDFGATSTKDISHVVLRYADGRVVKDDSIAAPTYAVDGGAADELVGAVVKSGRTTATFGCGGGGPPVALVETRRCTILGCADWFSHDSDGSHEQCTDINLPVSLRGISSTDPDGDIVSWTMSLDDGSLPVGGSWIDSPPTEVEHLVIQDDRLGLYTATLTVTDATGLTGTDQIAICAADFTPD